MFFRPGPVSKWFMVFSLLFGVTIGFGIAAVAMSFWSIVAGEEPHRGLFILIWMMAAVVFFAWPMHIVERARAVRRQRQVIRERIGDLDFEPSLFPVLGEQPPRPGGDLGLKAPDNKQPRLGGLLGRRRSAEQRMADHLMTLELEAEMRAAKESKTKSQGDP